MKKKLIVLLSLILMVSLFTGCAKKEEAAPAAEEAPAETEIADQLADIQKAGKLVVGIEGTYPPFNLSWQNGMRF